MPVAGGQSDQINESLLDAMSTAAHKDENLACEPRMRAREIALAERRFENQIRPAPKRAMLSNPLLFAVRAASAVFGHTAIVARVADNLNRKSQKTQAHQERIQEMLPVDAPDIAAANSRFLMDVGWVEDPVVRAGVGMHPERPMRGQGDATGSTGRNLSMKAPSPERSAQSHEAFFQTEYRMGYMQFGPLAQYCAQRFRNVRYSERVMLVNKAPHLLLEWLQGGTALQEWRVQVGIVEGKR